MSVGSLPLQAFGGQGIELEYMIVERDTLEPLPIADRVLSTEAGRAANDVLRGKLGWSNEFVMHVIEIKNVDPVMPMEELALALQREVRYLNRLLDHFHARLMPTAMHPWMDPASAQLWPQDPHGLYAAYARIFNCRTHGWANLQSMHLNLPFADDAEFARLHAAIRLLLPLLPALAASSPLIDGAPGPALDNRMQAYAVNADEFPMIAGAVVPPTMNSRTQYEHELLQPMYRAIAPHDPAGLLQHEWLNSHGAIARFDRNAIEIRVLDTQECPKADAALAAAVIGMLRQLMTNGAPLAMQQAISTESLATIFQSCVEQADLALVENEEYLALLGIAATSCTAGDALRTLVGKAIEAERLPRETAQLLQAMLAQGPLSRRILQALDGDFSRPRIAQVYAALCDCLDQGRMFEPGGA
jgi:glutamate---cysteine ligase / carboxylate-amine ligase